MASQLGLLTQELVQDVAVECQIKRDQVESTLKLLLSDCTVPFIARYRKEVTGGLDEVQIRQIRDSFDYALSLKERKETIVRSIEEQGKLTPELKAKIILCKVKSELEDLYLPFKPKKRTKGQIAKEKGLEPLALKILDQSPELLDLGPLFLEHVGIHPECVTLEQVIQGIRDYIAEHVAEIAEVRKAVRELTFECAQFVSEVRAEFADKKTKFDNYYKFSEPVKSIPPHRVLALRRGEKEDILRLSLSLDVDEAKSIMTSLVVKPVASDVVKVLLTSCIDDAYTKLLGPSIETEIRLELKNRSEEEAIRVFAKNLKNLLLLPPIPKRIVLGIDPGLRTGCKLAAVDVTGKLLEVDTIFPLFDSDAQHSKNVDARSKILDFCKRHKVEHIAIGNGTAGRETEAFVEKIFERGLDALGSGFSCLPTVSVVNEAGASVYSASDVARDELPGLDVSYRGAVSIARRLQDPLAELVKIEPKSIGVGQYQHDVNQSKLKKSLEETVESCVNFVGVNLNTASPSLLSYVAGIGTTLAKNIVKTRESLGEFKSRTDLYQVPGFGPKSFEQSAGFLRIPGAQNPLDASAVHPECYDVVESIASDLGLQMSDLVSNSAALQKIDLNRYIREDVGLVTLKDIAAELAKPGRDPREHGVRHTYSKEVRDIAQLEVGQILTGTVTNVTDFGAFVDIGVHQDGLVHISELASQFVKNVADVIAVGDQIKVKVIAVEKDRKRISLSRRAVEEGVAGAGNGKVQQVSKFEGSATGRSSAHAPGQRRPPTGGAKESTSDARRTVGGASGKSKKEGAHQPQSSQPASVSDLLSKFNSNRL